jgi:hypothetical protein
MELCGLIVWIHGIIFPSKSGDFGGFFFSFFFHKKILCIRESLHHEWHNPSFFVYIFFTNFVENLIIRVLKNNNNNIVLSSRWTGDQTQEEWVKFGYSSDKKKALIFKKACFVLVETLKNSLSK